MKFNSKKSQLQNKIKQEKQVLSLMIGLYCRRQHHSRGALCRECAALEAYAHNQTDNCPFMEEKTFCSNCQAHCYEPERREQIRWVMRYAAPKMIFYRPLKAMRYLAQMLKEKKKLSISKINKKAGMIYTMSAFSLK